MVGAVDRKAAVALTPVRMVLGTVVGAVVAVGKMEACVAVGTIAVGARVGVLGGGAEVAAWTAGGVTVGGITTGGLKMAVMVRFGVGNTNGVGVWLIGRLQPTRMTREKSRTAGVMSLRWDMTPPFNLGSQEYKVKYSYE